MGNQSTIDVALAEGADVLSEVVVVGYGIQKKANVTGSVSQFKTEELTRRQVPSSSQLLQGLAPGVSVFQGSGKPGGDAATIRVRGIGSIFSGSDPLIMVDGVVSSMDNVDANAIESITVLKDAASTSIYGTGLVPDLKRIEGTTDIQISRKADPESLIAQGDNGPFLVGNGWSDNAWTQGYRVIARANELIEGMKRGEAATPKVPYDKMRAEAITLRAWAYFNLMNWYGDVVYITKPLTPEEYETQSRTAVETVVKVLYS